MIHFYCAVNVTLIVNSISNSGQTGESFNNYKINNFWKKPVIIFPARPLAACLSVSANFFSPPKVTKLQLSLFNNLHFNPQKRKKIDHQIRLY